MSRFGGCRGREAVGLVLLCISCSEPTTQAPTEILASERPVLELIMVHAGSANDWSQYRVQANGRTANVFLVHDAQPKPVVFLLQGSACYPLFTVEPDSTYHPTIIFQDVIAHESNRVHFAMVEQIGVEPLRFSAGMTFDLKSEAFERAGRDCTAEYLMGKTKQARVEDVVATIEAITVEPWAQQIILAGHSEGTHVATGVLHDEPAIGVVAAGLFASTGPTPFWGGYVASGAGQREVFRSVFDRMRMLQQADDDFMYQGLPARRWRTFWLDSTPLDDVRDSTVPLFVAHGTRDGSILAPDLFVLEAIRRQPDRTVRYVVVENGGHAFEMPDGNSRIPELFDDFLDWALDPSRMTGIEVLN